MRSDWAAGRVKSTLAKGLILPWIMTVGFCGVTSAYLSGYGLFANPGQLLSEPSYLVLTPFVFVSAGLLLFSLRKTMLALFSGASTLDLTTIPGVIGGELAGVIHLPRQLRGDQGMRLTLQCVVIPWQDHGGRSSCTPYTAWQDDREIGSSGMTGDSVPVRFTIPADAPATTRHEDHPGGWHAVQWTLEALGEPGGFWCAEYEVPVFRTAQSPPLPAPEAPTVANIAYKVGSYLHGVAFDESSPERIERPPSTRIRTRMTTGGLEIRLPARTAFLVASLWVVLTLPLWVAPLLAARWTPQIAGSVTIGWSLVAAFVLNFLPAFFLVIGEPRRIEIGRREIVVHGGWPPLGRRRRFPMDQYDGIDASTQFFGVLRKNGTFLNRRFFLATTLASNAEARWLASVIEKAVARPAAAGAGS